MMLSFSSANVEDRRAYGVACSGWLNKAASRRVLVDCCSLVVF
jgi:hypothetical protein